MATRAETAAVTRDALVRAAADLLDEGGAAAVTLRGVGARAGVSRGAPYGHFASKEQLLRTLAVDAWESLATDVEKLRAAPDDAGTRLESAILALVGLGRRRPHLFELMFATPADDPHSAKAADRVRNAFLDLVGDLVGADDADRYGALLMSSAHGIASLERAGHLAVERWHVEGDELVRMLVDGIRLRTRH